jgi:hypothetical protein
LGNRDGSIREPIWCEMLARSIRECGAPQMSSPWIPVVGTAIGACVGTLATFGANWLGWKREHADRWDASRKDTYVQFLATSDRYHEALWRIIYRVRHQMELTPGWDAANDVYRDLVSQHDGVELLAEPAVRATGQRIFDRLKDFQQEIYKATRPEGDLSSLSTEDEYLKLYDPLRQKFLNAARIELAVERARGHAGDSAGDLDGGGRSDA